MSTLSILRRNPFIEMVSQLIVHRIALRRTTNTWIDRIYHPCYDLQILVPHIHITEPNTEAGLDTRHIRENSGALSRCVAEPLPKPCTRAQLTVIGLAENGWRVIRH